MIRRAPDDPTEYSYMDLSDQLLGEQALDASSTNSVFIHYIAVNYDGFEEAITGLYFIFRPAGSAEEDIPIMYLSVKKDEWLRSILQNKGTTLQTHEAALNLFRNQLAFTRIVRERNAQIVEIGDRKVHEGFEAEKRKLVNRITRRTYSSRYPLAWTCVHRASRRCSTSQRLTHERPLRLRMEPMNPTPALLITMSSGGIRSTAASTLWEAVTSISQMEIGRSSKAFI